MWKTKWENWQNVLRTIYHYDIINQRLLMMHTNWLIWIKLITLISISQAVIPISEYCCWEEKPQVNLYKCLNFSYHWAVHKSLEWENETGDFWGVCQMWKLYQGDGHTEAEEEGSNFWRDGFWKIHPRTYQLRLPKIHYKVTYIFQN